ncbi:MAG: tetratricopeptide repeat protein [Thermodesulfobacteriota bacterium]
MRARTLFSIVFTVMLFFVCAPPALADTAALLDEAIGDYESDNLEVSKGKLNEVLASDPENLTAFYYLGAIHYMQGNAAVAIPYLEKVAQSPTPIEGVEALLADAYLFAGKPGKALAHYGKRYAANPADEQVAFNYASCLQGVGREDEAEVIFERLIEGGGDYADASRYQLGDILAQRGAYGPAAKLFGAIDGTSPYAESARSYMRYLSPLTRLVSLYGSVDFFYDDNPGSTSAERTGLQQAAGGSNGTTLLAMIDTRALEFADSFKAKLGYMYYATLYTEQLANDNDFTGHYINPSLSYRIGPSIDLELKGDAQFFIFNNQWLSTNLGATFTATWTSKSKQSFKIRGAYLDQTYTGSFASTGSPASSLKYQDAITYTFGLGAVLSHEKAGTLALDYTFNDENTVNDNDPVLGPRALDSRFRENAFRADVTLPLRGPLSRLSILGNVSYSHKDYLIRQSGQLYPSAVGRHVQVRTLTHGISAQASLWKAAGLTLSLGMERTISKSIATELDYRRDRFFTKLTAYY